ncbi:hypothetical protein ACQ4M4_12670 [Leptolyngbya sp. AN02str]|uniref:hypothetical protein n=1 Tax=Leptolyngbya sp. AN02str TaxID=3423363 RepID=UPI003D3211C5
MNSESQNLSPLPGELWVIRLGRLPTDYEQTGQISAVTMDAAFQLSSSDEKALPPSLSVWAESLTTPKQAYGFLVENSPSSRCRLVLRLKVEDVRNIKGVAGPEKVYPGILNVIWDYLFLDPETKNVRDERPGANGHAGITGLDEKTTSEGLSKGQAKILRKDLRSKLADLASGECWVMDEPEL